MANERKKLACDIATGLAGWYQLQLAQGFGDFFGEDSAQLTILQIINSQRNFDIQASHPFAGHENSLARLDIVLKSKGKKGSFYGAIEIKWLGSSNPASSYTRSLILEDALRLSVVASGNLKANLLVVAGQAEKFDKLFGIDKRKFKKTEEGIETFAKLLQTEIDSEGTVSISEIRQSFKCAGNKLPNHLSLSDEDKISVRLLAKASISHQEKVDAGFVFVWLCLKGRGPKKKVASLIQETPQLP
ncbi:hypothetical protein [Rhodobacter ferrooxidans]|uniref:Uncharacterized protein n=1 Tax=Rhodobacter ferrooxidans TaxID=371731 RepID=C8S369_9RHOB|nr:hypothetical protein [Rhodobacter sp. SW2]EEW24551.1 hypothetical protein Rsw2DRAFT_2497 [Rhodobacter sp. SW2]